MKKRVLFYCQHLLGVGHLGRSLATCDDLVREFDVVFIQGGPDIGKTLKHPNFTHHFLTPLLMREEDSSLYDPAGLLTIEDLWTKRAGEVDAILKNQKFDFVITELFPFGRKKFKKEILGIIDQCRANNPATLVYCGLRDILVQKSDGAKRDQQMADIIDSHYDGVLAHSDPRILPLEDSFSAVDRIRSKVKYTGFITESKRPAQTLERRPEVLVSMGGGVVGAEMVLAVAKAAAEIPEYLFRFFLGPYAPKDLRDDLEKIARENPKARLSVEGFSKNFEADLERSILSISLAGYNTLMNTLNTKTMALVYPYMANEEQSLRARRLETTGALKVFWPEDLRTDHLVPLIRQYADGFPQAIDIDLEGSRNTTRFLQGKLHV